MFRLYIANILYIHIVLILFFRIHPPITETHPDLSRLAPGGAQGRHHHMVVPRAEARFYGAWDVFVWS